MASLPGSEIPPTPTWRGFPLIPRPALVLTFLESWMSPGRVSPAELPWHVLADLIRREGRQVTAFLGLTSPRAARVVAAQRTAPDSAALFWAWSAVR